MLAELAEVEARKEELLLRKRVLDQLHAEGGAAFAAARAPGAALSPDTEEEADIARGSGLRARPGVRGRGRRPQNARPSTG
ncbi:hypothetical protein WJX81_000410 [Elliptochloris bilobata]|uniref:Uncharacterized protein n=1 Tax=Elliptochloris bilobata TaxID=381761 RepID=A0AAW1SCS3_9CHLO